MKTVVTHKLIVIALALLVSSCFFANAQSELAPIEPENCTSDSACADGLVCDLKSGVCITDEPLELTAWFRLKPPPKGVLAVEQHYPEMPVSGEDDVSLTLHRPIRVYGRVLIEGNPLQIQEAQIIAVAEGEIPDLNVHEDAKATQGYFNYEEGLTDSPGYELLVNQGAVYDIYVHLKASEDGDERPPYHVRKVFNQSKGPQDPYTHEWDIEVPGEDKYIHIRGCVKVADETLDTLAGAEVKASAEASGNTSSTAVTGEDGCFDIAVQPLVDMVPELYEIRLKSTEQNPLVPSMLLAEIEVQPEHEAPVDNDEASFIELGDVVIPGLGELDEVTVVITASAETSLPEELAAKNATEIAQQLAEDRLVELTGDVVGSQVELICQLEAGTLKLLWEIAEVASEIEQEAGLVRVEAQKTLELPCASCVLTVIPPFHSPLGIHQQLYSLDDTLLPPPDGENPDKPKGGPEPAALNNLIIVELMEKAETSLLVLGPDGTPLEGVRIEAHRTDKGKFPVTAPLKSRTYQAEVDLSGEGYYLLSLDPGNYTIVVEPPDDANLPRLVEREAPISGSTTPMVFEFAEPAVVTGLVTGTILPEYEPLSGGGDGDEEDPFADKPGPYIAPAPGVKVELFDEAEGNSEPDAIPPIPIAEAYTDEEGRFVLIVPAQ